MNRRTSLKLISAFSISLIGSAVGAKKKNGNKKKKNDNKKKKNDGDKKNAVKAMKLTGEISVSQEDITKVYYIKSGRLYSFSRSVEGKIQSYVGQKVTVQCKVSDDRVISVDSVSVIKKS